MIKLAVFDLDGTLIDSIDDIADACNYTMAKLGYPQHSVAKIMQFVGDGARKLIVRCLPTQLQQENEKIEQALAIYRERYTNNLENKTKPYPGIYQLLTELKKKNIAVAVLSNKPDNDTKALVASQLGDTVDLALGQRKEVPRKPDPAGLFEIMEYFTTTPKETVYIGDTGVDMQTGKSAGAYTVGVSWGFRPTEVLKQAGADALVDNSQQLFEIIVAK